VAMPKLHGRRRITWCESRERQQVTSPSTSCARLGTHSVKYRARERRPSVDYSLFRCRIEALGVEMVSQPGMERNPTLPGNKTEEGQFVPPSLVPFDPKTLNPNR